jgi:hypothetical protein
VTGSVSCAGTDWMFKYNLYELGIQRVNWELCGWKAETAARTSSEGLLPYWHYKIKIDNEVFWATINFLTRTLLQGVT